jgi:hypothetical protein
MLNEGALHLGDAPAQVRGDLEVKETDHDPSGSEQFGIDFFIPRPIALNLGIPGARKAARRPPRRVAMPPR